MTTHLPPLLLKSFNQLYSSIAGDCAMRKIQVVDVMERFAEDGHNAVSGLAPRQI